MAFDRAQAQPVALPLPVGCTGQPGHAGRRGSALASTFTSKVGSALTATLAATLVWASAHAAPPVAPGAPTSAGSIFSCIDDQGRRITSDRPIPACMTREQRQLNKDGSLRGVHPPTLTPLERAEHEQRERQASEQRALQFEAVRRDRQLLARYKTEAALQRAREAAVGSLRAAKKLSEARMNDLSSQRKPLLEEAEFYANRRLPPNLRSRIDANDGAQDAQRAALLNQDDELRRIDAIYDAELARLKQLWGGAAPGSLGPLPARVTASASAVAGVGVGASKDLPKPAATPASSTTTPKASAVTPR